MESENNSKKALIVVICILVVIAVFMGGFIVMKSMQNRSNEEEKHDEENISEKFVGEWEADVEIDGEESYASLYLKNDNSFILVTPSVVRDYIVGSYDVLNSKIVFHERIFYSHEGCYDTNESLLQTFEGVVVNGDISLKIPSYGTNDYSSYGTMTFELVGDIEDTNIIEDYTLTPNTITMVSCKADVSKNEWKEVQYETEFKEDKTTVLDYDMKTNIGDFNYKSAYDLVVKESSSLKKGSNINLFDFVGRVNEIDDYYYVNYDVYFYNLPKEEYDKVKEQLKEDKTEKVGSCAPNRCSMKITKGYESISKYLIKKAYYYYIFDGKKKVETRSILSQSFVTSNIPDEWLKLGSYKTKDDMFKDVLLMTDETHKYDNYLVIYDTGSEIKFKYKNKSVTVIDKKNYEEDVDDLYSADTISSDKSAYVGGYKAFVTHDKDNNIDIYKFLTLRKDGTYTYGNNSLIGARSVGTYSLKDGKIILHDIVYYGNDACYITNETYLTDSTLTIKNATTLEITEDGKKLSYTKDSKLVESKESLARYITNPVNGKYPVADGDPWIHCSREGESMEPENSTDKEDLSKIPSSTLSQYVDLAGKTSSTGMYKNLSRILDNAIQQKKINGMSEIGDAIKTNGDMLKNQQFKNEFAFAYSYEFYKNDIKYLGEEVTKETGAYWLTEEEFKKAYKRVYNEEAPSSITFDNGYYKSGIFTGYPETDHYRFVETSNNGSKLVAKIYDSENDCYQKLDVENYCKTHGLELGRIEIEYTKNGNDYVFKTISLFTK